MCRLVVRNRDKVNPDSPYLDAQCSKRGFVIDILKDGQSLGKLGDKYDGWTVIELPGVAPEDASGFLAADVGDPKTNRMLQRRRFKFDLDVWEAGGKKALTLQQALAHQKMVPKREDPEVLPGKSKEVL